MAFELAEAYVELNQRGFGGVMSSIKGIGAGLVSMGPMALAAGGAIAAIGGAAGIAGLVSLAAESETTAVQFETLLQSADKAREHIADLKEFGASTPFEFAGLANTSKTLLAFGVAQDQIIPTMRVLGDVSSSTGSDLNELATVFGKIRGQGKLTGETLDQLVERKVPIIGELAKAFEVPEEAIRKMVSEGKIGFGDVQKALSSLTAEGGMMAGGMAAQSQTLSGLWSTFGDEMTGIMTDVANALAEGFDLKGGVASLTDFAAWFRETVIPYVVSGAQWMRESVVDNVMMIAQNADIYFEMFQEYASLAFTNAGIAINWFFDDWLELGKWFFENLGNFAWDYVNYQFTMMQNLWQLLKEGYDAYWAWVTGGEQKSLQERLANFAKFESSVTAFAGGKAPEWVTETARLVELQNELVERAAHGSTSATQSFGQMTIEQASRFGEKAGEKIAEAVGGASIVNDLFRTFAITALADYGQGLQAEALKVAQESAAHLAKVAGAVTANGLKIDMAGGGSTTVPYKPGYNPAAFSAFGETS